MLKKVIAASLLLFLMCSGASVNASVPTYQVFGEAIGISISDNYEPAYMHNNTFSKSEDNIIIKDKLQYSYVVNEILLRNKYDPTIYIFIYRVVMSPQDGRHWGVLGIGSYGGQYINASLRTRVELCQGAELLNYEPKNKPSETSGSIGLGYGNDGFSVSASVDYSFSELDINSYSNIGQNFYDCEFVFNNLTNDKYGKASRYLKHDVFLYGMLSFQSTSVTSIDVRHEIRFRDIAFNSSGPIKSEIVINRYSGDNI